MLAICGPDSADATFNRLLKLCLSFDIIGLKMRNLYFSVFLLC